MAEVTKEVADALIADLIIESEAGAASNDPMLARASRNTLAIASILALVLEGGAIEVPVDNSLADDFKALSSKVDDIAGKVDAANTDVNATGDAVHAIDNRLTALEAKFAVMEAEPAGAVDADADIANKLNPPPASVPPANADAQAAQNAGNVA